MTHSKLVMWTSTSTPWSILLLPYRISNEISRLHLLSCYCSHLSIPQSSFDSIFLWGKDNSQRDGGPWGWEGMPFSQSHPQQPHFPWLSPHSIHLPSHLAYKHGTRNRSWCHSWSPWGLQWYAIQADLFSRTHCNMYSWRSHPLVICGNIYIHVQFYVSLIELIMPAQAASDPQPRQPRTGIMESSSS